MIWESSAHGTTSQHWWFCLRHHTVEPDAGCPGKDRLGPVSDPGSGGPRAGDRPAPQRGVGRQDERLTTRTGAVARRPAPRERVS